MAPSHYAILGVPRDFTDEQLKKQYRLLALKYHPDRNPDDREAAERKFKEAGEAYSRLSGGSSSSEGRQLLRRPSGSSPKRRQVRVEKSAPCSVRQSDVRHNNNGQRFVTLGKSAI